MIQIFEALTNAYKGSSIEAIAGVNKIFSYIVPEKTSLPYVVISMAPSPISRPMSSPIKVEPNIFITPVSDFKKGQQQINYLKDAVIDTYDGAKLTVPGYSLVNIEPIEMQQVLDDDDPDELLWHYPVKFKINIE